MNTTTDTAPQLSEQNTKEKIFNILNLSIPILMGIFIFFNPFSHTTAIKETCFYGSVIIVLILICFKKIDFSFKSPLTLPFALFTAWAFIGLFFALYKQNSIHDFYAHLLKYIAIYYILVNFFNSRKQLTIMSWIIIISAAIFSIGGPVYFYLISDNDISTTRMTFQETPMGIIGFVTIFAILLSIHHFSKINLSQKLILLIAIAGMVIITFLTQSRGSLLGLIFSLLVLFPKNKKAVIIFSLSITIALSFVPFKNRLTLDAMQNKLLNAARYKIWRTHLEIVNIQPQRGWLWNNPWKGIIYLAS